MSMFKLMKPKRVVSAVIVDDRFIHDQRPPSGSALYAFPSSMRFWSRSQS